jgi:voltage-gated potassium channel Kch
MWLSFITITTTGYGDVLPASPLARSLAALEAMVGVLFPAIFISRLVSLVQGGARD